MKFPALLTLTFSLLLLTTVSTANAGHRLAVQGKGKLAIVDAAGKVEWEMPWGDIHDIHVLPSGNIVVQEGWQKVAEIDPKEKKVVWRFDAAPLAAGKPLEIHAFQPLADGNVMIALSGLGRIVEVNREGKVVARFTPRVSPDAPEVITSIEKELSAKTVAAK